MSQFKKNPEFVDKVCNTCKNTYQISFYKRKTSVYCSKKCANANEDVLTKMRTSQKKTYDEKYNGLHPMQTDKTKENLKSSLLDKYGVTSYSKLTEYKEKVKSTSIEKYGVENYSQTTEFKSNGINTQFNYFKTGTESGYENQKVFILKYQDFSLIPAN